MDYIVGGKDKRYYRIKKKKDLQKDSVIKADVSRISCKDYDDPKKNPNIGRVMPHIGDKVIIIIKPYQEYNCKTGIVDRLLTKKQIHTRGHKVMLHTGEVGRTLKILTQ
jgi:uncharacterized repeat protein (TIGR03833 family)